MTQLQNLLERHIRTVPDFPKPGVLFRDIAPLLASHQAFDAAITGFAERLTAADFDSIAGIESRGFIFGAALAQKMGKGFVPIRKKGKLPPPVVAHTYSLEYGTDTLEMQPGTGRVVLIDDVLATGGTAKAALDLCERAGYAVEEVTFLINLAFLNDMKWRGESPFSLLTYR